VGGDLSSGRLLSAYRRGIFPWYSTGQPILWWSPDPRTVLYPDALKISRSLKKTLRHRGYRVTTDQYFSGVIQACAKPRDRNDDSGTWITPEMIKAYTTLNASGYAHSLEVWDQMKLVGGLYGVAIGRVFFGESMFSNSTDASKIALTALVSIISEKKFQMIDCQVPSEHLFSLGARNIPRARFSDQLQAALAVESQPATWNYSFDSLDLL